MAVIKCPECGSDDVEPDQEYASCNSCGHQGRSIDFNPDDKLNG